MTVNLKNNRVETITSDGGLTLASGAKFSPNIVTVSLAALAEAHTILFPVHNAAGTLVGYVKVFPVE